MYNFCVDNMSQPLWIVNGQSPPLGTYGANSAYIWGLFNNGSGVVKERVVKNAATIKP